MSRLARLGVALLILLGAVITSCVASPGPEWGGDADGSAAWEIQSGALTPCGGETGKPCGCLNDRACAEPCRTCCETVPCPVEGCAPDERMASAR